MLISKGFPAKDAGIKNEIIAHIGNIRKVDLYPWFSGIKSEI